MRRLTRVTHGAWYRHGVTQGYAFCEYSDISVTDAACEGLNGLQVGDKNLTVRRAMPRGGAAPAGGSGADVGPVAVAVAAAPVATPAQSAFQPRKAPTPVIVLRNMVSANEVANDAEYADILDDVRQECAKFGTVRSVSIPRQGTAVGKVGVRDSGSSMQLVSSRMCGLFRGTHTPVHVSFQLRSMCAYAVLCLAARPGRCLSSTRLPPKRLPPRRFSQGAHSDPTLSASSTLMSNCTPRASSTKLPPSLQVVRCLA